MTEIADKLVRGCAPELTPVDSTEVEAGITLKIMRAWRTECAPTEGQRALLFRYFGCARWAWNWGLGECMKAYESEKKHLSAFTLSVMLTALKRDNTELAWLNEPPRSTLDYALADVDLAYKHFFRRVKSGEKPGFPKFKARNRTIPRCRFRKVARCNRDGIELPKIGFVRVKERDYLPLLAKKDIAFATVTFFAGKFWLSVTGKSAQPAACVDGDGSAAIEYDFERQRIMINGAPVDVPTKTQHEDRHIRLLQARISRRQEGSPGYWRARELHQRWERRIADRRYQFLHNLSTRLVNENAEITVYRPDVKTIVEGGENDVNKAILSNAMAEFFRQLEYKSCWYGRVYTEVGCALPEIIG